MPESLKQWREATEELVYYEEKVLDRCHAALTVVKNPEAVTARILPKFLGPQTLHESIRKGWEKSEDWVGIFLLDSNTIELDEQQPNIADENPIRLSPNYPMFGFIAEFFQYNRQLVDILKVRVATSMVDGLYGRNVAYMSYTESLVLRSAIYNQVFTATSGVFNSEFLKLVR